VIAPAWRRRGTCPIAPSRRGPNIHVNINIGVNIRVNVRRRGDGQRSRWCGEDDFNGPSLSHEAFDGNGGDVMAFPLPPLPGNLE